MATRVSTLSKNAALNALLARADGGELRIYSGTQPADGDTAAAGTLLATFSLPADVFPAAADGEATANAISDTTGAADGTAGWFRVVNSGATENVMDGAVGAELTLNTNNISTGVAVSITGWTVTQG